MKWNRSMRRVCATSHIAMGMILADACHCLTTPLRFECAVPCTSKATKHLCTSLDKQLPYDPLRGKGWWQLRKQVSTWANHRLLIVAAVWPRRHAGLSDPVQHAHPPVQCSQHSTVVRLIIRCKNHLQCLDTPCCLKLLEAGSISQRHRSFLQSDPTHDTRSACRLTLKAVANDDYGRSLVYFDYSQGLAASPAWYPDDPSLAVVHSCSCPATLSRFAHTTDHPMRAVA